MELDVGRACLSHTCTCVMSKIVYWMGMSVDGYMEGPNRQIEWHNVDEELHSFFNNQLREAGAFLGGRVTHELMADFWPRADDDPDAPPTMREFAGIWRDKPKFVYSRTLESADWNTTVLREVIPDDVMAMKGQFEGDMILGGTELGATFAALDLIDEYRIYVHPTVIGSGKPILDKAYDPKQLKLIETRTFGNGVVMLRYERVRHL